MIMSVLGVPFKEEINYNAPLEDVAQGMLSFHYKRSGDEPAQHGVRLTGLRGKYAG